MTGEHKPRFCAECGTEFLPDAAFCHNCGVAVGGRASPPPPGLSPTLKWGVPVAAIVALTVLSVFRMGVTDESRGATAVSIGPASPAGIPDISSMSPTERADRLFNRVMRLWSEGKADSAAFFAPMALSAFEGIAPMTPHVRYDVGLVALIAGDLERASVESDSILAARQDHLLGLVLGARVADARGDLAAGKAFRERLARAEKSERASGLQEYQDHAADINAAIPLGTN